MENLEKWALNQSNLENKKDKLNILFGNNIMGDVYTSLGAIENKQYSVNGNNIKMRIIDYAFINRVQYRSQENLKVENVRNENI